VQPQLVDDEGKVLEERGRRQSLHHDSWPGQMRTVYGDHERFVQTYFSTYKGKYFTGDGCRRDADGYYWITGRVDDVINVSGHRMGTAEVESALVAHPKGVGSRRRRLSARHQGPGHLLLRHADGRREGRRRAAQGTGRHVRKEIGPIASPDKIQFAPGLPKTRSGKIMRRILRKIAEDDFGALGDTSTLADPAVVDDLITVVARHRRDNQTTAELGKKYSREIFIRIAFAASALWSLESNASQHKFIAAALDGYVKEQPNSPAARGLIDLRKALAR
jgi:acetyl-CoA synthetase